MGAVSSDSKFLKTSLNYLRLYSAVVIYYEVNHLALNKGNPHHGFEHERRQPALVIEN